MSATKRPMPTDRPNHAELYIHLMSMTRGVSGSAWNDLARRELMSITDWRRAPLDAALVLTMQTVVPQENGGATLPEVLISPF